MILKDPSLLICPLLLRADYTLKDEKMNGALQKFTAKLLIVFFVALEIAYWLAMAFGVASIIDLWRAKDALEVADALKHGWYAIGGVAAVGMLTALVPGAISRNWRAAIALCSIQFGSVAMHAAKLVPIPLLIAYFQHGWTPF